MVCLGPGNYFCFVFKRFNFFRAVLGFEAVLARSTEISHILAPNTCTASPTVNIPHSGGHLLQWMNLQWHVDITQSPHLALGFIPGGVHSMGLGTCLIACVTTTVSHRVCSLPDMVFFKSSPGAIRYSWVEDQGSSRKLQWPFPLYPPASSSNSTVYRITATSPVCHSILPIAFFRCDFYLFWKK